MKAGNYTVHFYDSSKKLPNESKTVIIIHLDNGGEPYHFSTVNYSNKYKKFNACDHFSEKLASENGYDPSDKLLWADPEEVVEE